MGQVVKRKFITSIVSGFICALLIPLSYYFDGSQSTADQYFPSVIVVSIYLFPISIIYGNLTSISLEMLFINVKGIIFIIINGLLHVGFGLLVGIVFEYYIFYFYGGLTAGLYFIIDLFLKKYLKDIWRAYIRTVGFSRAPSVRTQEYLN